MADPNSLFALRRSREPQSTPFGQSPFGQSPFGQSPPAILTDAADTHSAILAFSAGPVTGITSIGATPTPIGAATSTTSTTINPNGSITTVYTTHHNPLNLASSGLASLSHGTMPPLSRGHSLDNILASVNYHAHMKYSNDGLDGGKGDLSSTNPPLVSPATTVSSTQRSAVNAASPQGSTQKVLGSQESFMISSANASGTNSVSALNQLRSHLHQRSAGDLSAAAAAAAQQADNSRRQAIMFQQEHVNAAPIVGAHATVGSSGPTAALVDPNSLLANGANGDPAAGNATAPAAGDGRGIAGDIILQQLPSSSLLYVLVTSEGRDKSFKLVQYLIKFMISVLNLKGIIPNQMESASDYWSRRLERNIQTVRNGRSMFKLGRWLVTCLHLQTCIERLKSQTLHDEALTQLAEEEMFQQQRAEEGEDECDFDLAIAAEGETAATAGLVQHSTPPLSGASEDEKGKKGINGKYQPVTPVLESSLAASASTATEKGKRIYWPPEMPPNTLANTRTRSPSPATTPKSGGTPQKLFQQQPLPDSAEPSYQASEGGEEEQMSQRQDTAGATTTSSQPQATATPPISPAVAAAMSAIAAHQNPNPHNLHPTCHAGGRVVRFSNSYQLAVFQPADDAQCKNWRKSIVDFPRWGMYLLIVRCITSVIRNLFRDSLYLGEKALFGFSRTKVGEIKALWDNVTLGRRTSLQIVADISWLTMSSIDLFLNSKRLLQKAWIAAAIAGDADYYCQCNLQIDRDDGEVIWIHIDPHYTRRMEEVSYPKLDFDFGCPTPTSSKFWEAANPSTMKLCCTRCGCLLQRVPKTDEVPKEQRPSWRQDSDDTNAGGERANADAARQVMVVPYFFRKCHNVLLCALNNDNLRNTLLLQMRYMCDVFLAYSFVFGDHFTSLPADKKYLQHVNMWHAAAGIASSYVALLRVMQSSN